MDTREVAQKYFEYYNSRNWDGYLSLLDEHVDINEQMMGHVQGIEAVRNEIIGRLKNNPPATITPQKIVVEGEEAMSIWILEADLPNGTKFSVKGTNYFKVKNGKIVDFASYHDTAPFMALMGKA